MNVEQHLLALADGEYRNQYGAAAFQRLRNRFPEPHHLFRPGIVGAALETAARALHNQRIYAGFRKISPGNHALVFKLHVPRVKYGMAALALQHHAGRPQDVPGIIKRGQHVLAEAHAKHFIAGLGMPGVAQSVQIIMGEKRILHNAQVQPLGAHHIHGIMQHHFRQGCRGGRHEHLRRWLFLLKHRQRSQMVQVGMA